MVNIQACPICKNHNLQEFTHCEDHTVSHETFHVVRCVNCMLASTSPRPDTDKLGAYYQSEEYISHSGKSSGGIGFLYKIARSFSLNWKKKNIHRHKTGGSILDFGCGTGEFLNTMRQSGWDITGVEPTSAAAIKAETLTTQKIYSQLEAVPQNKFDVITAWHVLEHVPDLIETSRQLAGLLKKDGIIFIAVPNYQSPDADSYQAHWAGFDVPRHLWHFSKSSMSTLLESVGLKLIDIVPMKLDAYYVSMLSEKYRNENSNGLGTLINGFLSGLKSNMKARKNLNHSSLIYVSKVHEA